MLTTEREQENVHARIVKGEYGLEGVLDSTHELNPGKLNILAIIHDRATACEEYRVIQPLQELEKRGHNCFIMNAGYLQKRYRLKIDDFVGADLVLFNRMMEADGYDVPKIARDRGAAIICDYDDDLTGFYRRVSDSKFPNIKLYDAITVASEWLKVLYGGMNKHIHVLPNVIQARRFEGWERDIKEPTITLTGSVTHENDWKVAVNPILHVLERHSEWRCFVSGYMPVELAGHPQVLVPGLVKPEWSHDMLKVPYAKYGWLLANTDILLVPVDPADKFNWGKSSLKVREGMTAGCACIATGSPLPCYANDIQNGLTGLLVNHDEASWEAAIEMLVCDHELRDRIRSLAKTAALNFTAEGQAEEREKLYTKIIERHRRRTR